MSSPTPPPRIRDIASTREKSRRKGLRSLYVVLLWIAIPVTVILAWSLLRQTVIRPRVDPTVESTDLWVTAGESIQINIINACGADGIARKFTEFLRARKFDVAETMNGEHHEPYSKVLDRVGDRLSARKVAYALGIDEKRIERAIDSSLYLRATVVVGEDYGTLRPMHP